MECGVQLLVFNKANLVLFASFFQDLIYISRFRVKIVSSRTNARDCDLIISLLQRMAEACDFFSRFIFLQVIGPNLQCIFKLGLSSSAAFAYYFICLTLAPAKERTTTLVSLLCIFQYLIPLTIESPRM